MLLRIILIDCQQTDPRIFCTAVIVNVVYKTAYNFKC